MDSKTGRHAVLPAADACSRTRYEHGFRGSPEYGRWRELLHGFYEPFPVVEHFAEVARAEVVHGV